MYSGATKSYGGPNYDGVQVYITVNARWGLIINEFRMCEVVHHQVFGSGWGARGVGVWRKAWPSATYDTTTKTKRTKERT